MSDDLIAEALKLSEKATPAPWYAGAQNDALFIVIGRAPSSSNDDPWHDAPRTVLAAMRQPFSGQQEVADAAFIARARTLVPELAEALAAERALADQLAEALRAFIALWDFVTEGDGADDLIDRLADFSVLARSTHAAWRALSGDDG